MIKRAIAVTVTLLLAMSFAACGADIAGIGGSYVRISYDTGVSGDMYNTDLFYRNDQFAATPDPGVLYVPEGREGGGYYYMYTTEVATVDPDAVGMDTQQSAFWVMRSKDLVDWELCGNVNHGYAFAVNEEMWMESRFWAPECYYDEKEELYYLYFTAASKIGDAENEYSSSDNVTARTYVVVANSDSPMGPFEYVWGVNADGKVVTTENPQINFREELGLDYDFAIIDVHVFEDGDDMYMYFCESRNVARPGNTLSVGGVWGVKMKDRITPDYTTLTKLTVPGVKQVVCEGEPGIDGTYRENGEFSTAQGTLIEDEGEINEGPFMIKHGDKYYLTYSQGGYVSRYYSVWQAVGDSPLGPFTKLDASEGGLVLGPSSQNDYLVGTAHHCFTYAGDELMIVYHGHLNPLNYTDNDGRAISVDRVQFIDSGNGYDVMVADGPTKSLQYKPEAISGYKNYARDAEITVSGGEGAAYLNDGFFPSHDAFGGEREYVSDGKAEITLKFASPVSVSSVMIYNSMLFDAAFASVDSIVFKLAEVPAWFNDVKADYALIEGLAFPEDYYDPLDEYMQAGGSAVAVFEPMLVSEITIAISQPLYEGALDQLRVAEIVVLGKSA